MLNSDITVFFQHVFQYQTTANPTFVPAPSMDGWFRPLSEPVKTVSKAAVLIAASGFFGPVGLIPSDVGLASDTWSQPPARIRQVQYQTQTSGTNPVVPFDWRQQLSEPVRTKASLSAANQQSLAYVQIAASEIVTVDKWYVALSEPVRQKLGLLAASQQSIAFVQAAPFAEATFESKWHYAWSEPVRQKLGLLAALQAAPDYWSTFTPSAEIVTLDKWYAALAEPVRQKSALQVASQHFFSANFSPIVSFSWYQELATPPKVKVSIAPASQQFIAAGTNPIVSFDWRQWLSEPVRQKTGLQAQFQKYLEFDPNPLVSFSWFGSLADPIRQKQGLQAQFQKYLEFDPNPLVSFSWFNSLTDPIVKIKLWLAAANQGQPAWSTFTPAGEIVTLDKWYIALAEPVRQKRGLQAGSQHFFSVNFSPIVSFSWYQDLSVPPKIKVSLGTAQQQYLAFVKAAPFGETVLESEWHQPWSVPVRRLPPLRVAPETAMVPFTLPYAIVSFGWNSPQTQLPPQRLPGLDARYQQAFTAPLVPLTTINITGILAAIETRDRALFGGIVYNAPFAALVGIIEQAVPPTPTSAVVSIASVSLSIREI